MKIMLNQNVWIRRNWIEIRPIWNCNKIFVQNYNDCFNNVLHYENLWKIFWTGLLFFLWLFFTWTWSWDEWQIILANVTCTLHHIDDFTKRPHRSNRDSNTLWLDSAWKLWNNVEYFCVVDTFSFWFFKIWKPFQFWIKMKLIL